MGDFQNFLPNAWFEDGMLREAPPAAPTSHVRRRGAVRKIVVAVASMIAAAPLSFSVVTGSAGEQVPAEFSVMDDTERAASADGLIIESPDVFWKNLVASMSTWKQDLRPDPVDIEPLI